MNQTLLASAGLVAPCLFAVMLCLVSAGTTSEALLPHIVQVTPSERASQESLDIPAGRPIRVDGIMSAGEWDDAGFIDIVVQSQWKVRVFYKHDDQNIYFAFQNVRQGNTRLYPEVLIDSEDTKSGSWTKGQWWLHASYNLCEENGSYNVYQRDGKFLCSHRKSGWDANNPPKDSDEVIEFEVSLSKIGLRQNARFGIAFDVTDATGDAHQSWYLWPPLADVRHPKTWGEALLR